jgi:two-component sensor histidine kinase
LLRHDQVTGPIDWVERGGPPASPPEQRGFGSRLVVGCMRSLGGRVDADVSPEGLECRLTMPFGGSDTGQRDASGQNSTISGTPASTT